MTACARWPFAGCWNRPLEARRSAHEAPPRDPVRASDIGNFSHSDYGNDWLLRSRVFWSPMTDAPSPARARAELAFRSPVAAVAPETKLSAMDEYRAKQAATLDNMARLRALRMTKGKL